MENIEWIVSLTATAVALVSSAVGFIAALVKAIKARDAEKCRNLLSEAAIGAVEFAEKLVGASRESKKAAALNRIAAELAESGAQYDEQAASDAVEKLIGLSKEVNARGSYIPAAADTTVGGTRD